MSMVINPFWSAASFPEPPFAKVVLLLGFEGVDAATATTDESNSAHAITFNGNAQLDTAQSKFGVSSCLFDGSGDYLSSPDHADWRLSAANSDTFTIEFWIRAHANVTNQRVMGQAPSGSGNLAWYINSTWSSVGGQHGNVSFNYSSNGSTGLNITTVGDITGDLVPNLDTWYFVAVTKNSSGKIRIWLNGTLDNSATPADSSIFNSTNAFEIGRAFATANFNGWIDELRICKDFCRYDTDGPIPLPTAAFPRS